METRPSDSGLRDVRPSSTLRRQVKQLVLAPLRTHRYRDVHTRMLRDALCQMDCGTRADR